MKASGVTDEQVRSGNMAVIFGLAYVLSLIIAFTLSSQVIHQLAAASLVATVDQATAEGQAAVEAFEAFMTQVGTSHRSFGHGFMHGGIAGLLFAGPLFGIIALFERRSFRYVAIHTGYWFLSLALMGGTIAALF